MDIGERGVGCRRAEVVAPAKGRRNEANCRRKKRRLSELERAAAYEPTAVAVSAAWLPAFDKPPSRFRSRLREPVKMKRGREIELLFATGRAEVINSAARIADTGSLCRKHVHFTNRIDYDPPPLNLHLRCSAPLGDDSPSYRLYIRGSSEVVRKRFVLNGFEQSSGFGRVL